MVIIFFPAENLLKVHLAQRDIKIHEFFIGIFRTRDPNFCFNYAYAGLKEKFYSSKDYDLELDHNFNFYKKII